MVLAYFFIFIRLNLIYCIPYYHHHFLSKIKIFVYRNVCVHIPVNGAAVPDLTVLINKFLLFIIIRGANKCLKYILPHIINDTTAILSGRNDMDTQLARFCNICKTFLYTKIYRYMCNTTFVCEGTKGISC